MKFYLSIGLIFAVFLAVSTLSYSDEKQLQQHHKSMVQSGTWPAQTSKDSYRANARINQLASCNDVALLAILIMNGRQKGIAKQQALTSTSNNQLALIMVHMAYKNPIIAHKKKRHALAKRFGWFWYKHCI